jgi:hypothetical protein
VKAKRLVFIGCFAAAALIASPALSQPQKKSAITSTSRSQRMVPRTSQVTPTYRHERNWRYGGTSHYGGTRYYGGN